MQELWSPDTHHEPNGAHPFPLQSLSVEASCRGKKEEEELTMAANIYKSRVSRLASFDYVSVGTIPRHKLGDEMK
jgi:hypothetical protein